MDASEIKAFAAAYDPQPFHLDEDAAQASFFAGLAASGWHTAAVTMRLVVDSIRWQAASSAPTANSQAEADARQMFYRSKARCWRSLHRARGPTAAAR